MTAACTVSTAPLSERESAAFGTDRLVRVTADQEPVSGPITLYEAMARALKYNLDTRVELMEAALKARELDLAHYSALPRLVASSGYAGRSEGDAATPSTRDKNVFTADLTFAWNILDFGLSYVRAKQAADRVLVQEEMKRKTLNRVIEEVRSTYWRAASYERLVGRMRALESRVTQARRNARELAGSGDSSPLAILTYERELAQVQREIEGLEGELRSAKSQLAALMNLTPGTPFAISGRSPSAEDLRLPSASSDRFAIAVAHRPEMREIAYRIRINEREVQAALMELLPNFNVYVGANHDSNRFLDVNDWISWGSKVSWNLLRLVSLPAIEAKADAQKAVLDTRSLAVAMAVMTQVHISGERYAQLLKSYRTSETLAGIARRILDQVRAESAAERTSELILIREELGALLAEARRDRAYAELQSAYANLHVSLGLDPFPPGLSTGQSVRAIAASLEAMWRRRGGPLALHTARLK